jgi:hypothetical protein
MDNYHLLPNGDDWNLTPEGSNRPLAIFSTRAKAIAGGARVLSKSGGGSLKIYREDYTIEEEHTYPRETPG